MGKRLYRAPLPPGTSRSVNDQIWSPPVAGWTSRRGPSTRRSHFPLQAFGLDRTSGAPGPELATLRRRSSTLRIAFASMPGRFSRRCRRPSRPPSRVCKQGAGVRVRLAPGDDHSQPPLRMATPTLSTIRQTRSVSNQLSNYGGVQTGTHPASRGPGRRSIRTQARPPGLLRDEAVADLVSGVISFPTVLESTAPGPERDGPRRTCIRRRPKRGHRRPPFHRSRRGVPCTPASRARSAASVRSATLSLARMELTLLRTVFGAR
jgi:hypothetical protein